MIHEIKDILELIPHLNPDDWVFLDLDDTLIEPIHAFGSKSWEKLLIEQHLEKGKSKEIALERSSLIWKSIQAVSPIQFVQPEIPQLFDFLNKHKINYKILTARSSEMIQVTERQLSTMGLECRIESEPQSIIDQVVVKGNVIYCKGQSKGFILRNFLRQQPIKHIIMVDDYLHHLLDAQNELTPDYSFAGFRYGRTDEKHVNYYPDQTTELLHKILFDPEALQFFIKGLQKAD